MSERFGKYELQRRIAVGGMGEVFVARAHGAEGFVKEVVIKRILPAFTEDPEFVEMFIREARLAARLRHANVVQILDFDQVGGQYYIAMEWIDGPDLRRVQSAARRRAMAIPPAMAIHVGVEVLKGLHYAHTRSEGGQELGIVHRDISPHNLLVSLAGEVKVADFGVAKVAALTSSTGPGALKGKLTYMAPEQVDGSSVDQRCDLFSLGVVLWELLAGRRLYSDSLSQGELIAAIQRCEIPPLEPLLASPVPDGVTDTVHRLLRADPGERYQRAADALSDLSRIAGASEALAVSDYLRRLMPEDSERDRKGRTEVAAAPVAGEPRPAGPHDATHTRSASGNEGSGEAASDAVSPSVSLSSQRTPDGAVSGTKGEGQDLEREAGARRSVGAARVETGRLPLPHTRDRALSVALFGALVFVLALAAVRIWRAGRDPQPLPSQSPTTAAGAVVIRNARPPGNLAVNGVPLGTGKISRVFAPAGTELRVRADRGRQAAEHQVLVRGDETETLSISFGRADAGPAVEHAVVGSATERAESATSLLSAGQAALSPGEPDRAPAREHKPAVRQPKNRAKAPRRPRALSRGRGEKKRRAGDGGRRDPSRASGKVTVVVYPWANLSIDGQSLGNTPLVGHALPVGRHVLTLSNRELGKEETVVLTISSDKTVKIRRNWMR